jgi:hypothetical protein
MGQSTFGESLKQKIDNEETHLEYLGIKYGMNSHEYQSAAKKIEAKRKYVESIKGHARKSGARRG